MAEASGQVYDFAEGTPAPGDRGPTPEAAPFIAVVEQLMTRVRSAKLRDHAEVLDDLRAWIDRALRGEMNVPRDGDQIAETLTTNVDEMIDGRTLRRRVAAPLGGLGLLYLALAGLTVWTVAGNSLFLGASLSLPLAAIIMGTAGSSFRVLIRTVTAQHTQTDHGALLLTGLARPLVGGVLALGIFALFGSGIISLPIVSDQETSTFIDFLSFPGTGPGLVVGQLALFAFAFIAGLLEGFIIPAAGRGVARVLPRRPVEA
jgi:hypothetical protein